ncbi:MAG: DUF3999 family protein [Campylobacteraceae bacterium]
MIKPINSSFVLYPEVTLSRKELDVVFNSANGAPFILAYGSNIAKSASVPIGSFEDLYNLADTNLKAKTTLSGEKAFNQKDGSVQESLILSWAIWAILIFGVIVLVFLAFRLSKEIKKEI